MFVKFLLTTHCNIHRYFSGGEESPGRETERVAQRQEEEEQRMGAAVSQVVVCLKYAVLPDT